jgi:hypothetical protein
MSHAKHASKRKRRSKTLPVLGATGLSLSLAGGASATGELAADAPTTRNTAVNHEIILGEEEIYDVSLATFYVFDKENNRSQLGQPLRLAAGCRGGGCGCGHGCGGCGRGGGCGGCAGARGCAGFGHGCGGCRGCRGCGGCGGGGWGGCGGCGWGLGWGGCCLSWGGCLAC